MAAPVVAAVASADNDSIAYTVAVPAGTANGDLLIGVVASDWGTDAGNAFPAGWTKLTTASYSAGTNAFHIALYARVASSEPATYTVALDAAASVAAILRITGWDSAAGIATAVKQVAPSTTGTGRTAPSIVPAGTDDLLLTFHGAEISGSGANTWTPPTGMTEDVDRQSTIWTSLEVTHLASPSNPSGTKAATPSINVNTGAACTLSIKAPGGGSNNQAITPSAETDTALTPARQRIAPAGTAAEAETALTPARQRQIVVSPSTETELALTPARSRLVAITPALETDTALPPAQPGGTLITPALETDTALTPTRQRLAAVAIAAETEQALSPARSRLVPVLAAVETDTAQTPVQTRTTLVLPALELDEAQTPHNPNEVLRDLDLRAVVEPARFTVTIEPARFRTEIDA